MGACKNYIVQAFSCKAVIHSPQTIFPLNLLTFVTLPQKVQAGSYFLRIIFSPSTNISKGSFTSIPRVRLNSIGKTMRPRVSTFLTIPVAFNFILPPSIIYLVLIPELFRRLVPPLHNDLVYLVNDPCYSML